MKFLGLVFYNMEEEIVPSKKFSLGIAELRKFRELFYFFAWRDIKVKYKQTFFGVAWALLQPFLMMVVFSLFFGYALKVPSDQVPYPVFVYSGLLLWNLFAGGITSASNSMVANANIIQKIYFPRLIIPLSSILVSGFDFLMGLVIYIGLLVFYSSGVDWNVLWTVPLALFMTLMTTFGLGTFLAALNVKYRDFRYIIPFVTQLLLFVSPVIYPASVIKNPWVQQLFFLNPMAGAVELFRSPVVHQAPVFSHWFTGLTIAFLVFLLGISYFRKTEYYFADLA